MCLNCLLHSSCRISVSLTNHVKPGRLYSSRIKEEGEIGIDDMMLRTDLVISKNQFDSSPPDELSVQEIYESNIFESFETKYDQLEGVRNRKLYVSPKNRF
jgi:hypothetical protein